MRDYILFHKRYDTYMYCTHLSHFEIHFVFFDGILLRIMLDQVLRRVCFGGGVSLCKPIATGGAWIKTYTDI